MGFASRTLAVGATAATHLWLARELGPTGYGSFVLALFIQNVVALLSNIGMGSALSYEVARRPHLAEPLTRVALALSMLSALAVAPLAWVVLTSPVARPFPELGAAWILAGIVTVPLRLMQEDLAGVCTGLGLLERTFAQYAMGPVFLLATLVATRIASPFDEVAVSSALVIGNVAATSFSVALTIPLMRASAGGPLEPGTRRQLFSLGIQQSFNTGGWFLLGRVNRAVVAVAIGLDAAGRFAVSASIAEILTYIPAAIQLSMFTRVARAEAGDALAETRRSIRNAVVLVSAGSLIVLVVAAFGLSPLLGSAYSDAAVILTALVPGVIALAPVSIIAAYFLAGLGRAGVNLLPVLSAITVLVPATWLLGNSLGAVGAAIGTSLAYCVAGAVAVALLAGRTRSVDAREHARAQ